ncbi:MULTISPECIES: DUF5908 family protein [unclassified Burkholderia]|uniref:DUF5908 family protein n=1 Tax=unclassified Burkholderia TaxID=2613784 RepID=UPI000AED8E05|nr:MULTISPECIES: DUF5908 family protein [unclassified Burkholderia]
MTLEIRELVIEARVVDDTSSSRAVAVDKTISDAERAKLVEQVARRVLEWLSEQRERL